MSRRSESVSRRTLRRWGLPDPGGSKYDRGTVLVVGGSLRCPGAVVLAGVAALRAGAGRITLGVPRSVAPAVGVAVPESGIVALADTEHGSLRTGAHAVLGRELDRAQAALIGSGIDDVEVAEDLLEGLVASVPETLVVVLDAFALGAVAGRPEVVAPLQGRLILTPSPAELGVLLGGDDVDAASTPALERAAREVARRYRAVVATQALVVAPDGARWRIRAGGPALGTSGSGDVLAGAIAGFAARGVPLARAAVWGTYVHAAAGDELAHGRRGVGLLARELSDRFPAIIARGG